MEKKKKKKIVKKKKKVLKPSLAIDKNHNEFSHLRKDNKKERGKSNHCL